MMSQAENYIDSSTCCLCLSEDETTFNSNSLMKSLPLHEMVNFCIGIRISTEKEPNYGISTSICNECVLNINNFYTFKKRVLEAQELINGLKLTNENHENDSESEYLNENGNSNTAAPATDEELELEEGEEEEQEIESYEVHQTEDVSIHDAHNSEYNNEHPGYDAQSGLANNQESSIQSVVCPAISGTAKKRTNKNVTAPKQSHKKTKLNTQEQSTGQRFTLQINECLICPAILRDILELKDHIEAHQHIKCKACHRQFVRYSNLKRHFNAEHSKPKPFICDMCGLGFNFSVNLQSHYNQSHAAHHYPGRIQNGT